MTGRLLLLLVLVAALGTPGFGAEAGPGADEDAARFLQQELRRQLAERLAEANAQAAPQREAAAEAQATIIPGRAEPVAPSAPAAWEIDWDDYLTLIVIEPGDHLRRPAWVATRHKGVDDLAVAYAGTAFIDARGDVHIDCRNAHLSGPMASQWSPDSFAIEDGGRVRIIDDADRGNPGRVLSATPARERADGDLSLAFRKARLLARMYVEGAL